MTKAEKIEAPTFKPGEEMTHKGIRYIVAKVRTRKDYESDGLSNIAGMMRYDEIVSVTIARRPSGHKLHLFHEFAGGVFVYMVSV